MRRFSFRSWPPLRAAAALAVGALLGGSHTRAADAPSPLVFEDVTSTSGLGAYLDGALIHAIAWGDLNGDDQWDLYLGCFNRSFNEYGPQTARPNTVWTNGAGHFTHRSQPQLETFSCASSAVWADLDHDGLLDLFATNVRRRDPRKNTTLASTVPSQLFRNAGGTLLPSDPLSGGAAPADAYSDREVALLDYDQDGWLDLYVTQDRYDNPEPKCRLYQNLGNLTFREVTSEVGLPDAMNGFGVAVADVNDDGRPDLFVANANRLFLSDGLGRYQEPEALAGVFELPSPRRRTCITTSAVFGDVDNDGDLDLLLGTHYYGGESPIALFINEGLDEARVPRFRNVTREVLGRESFPNKPANGAIADFDNDGQPDLYWSVAVAIGDARHLFICRGLGVRDGLPRFDVPEFPELDPELTSQNRSAPDRYTQVYYVNGAPVDIDQDGRLDILAGSWPPEPSRLFRNVTTNGNHALEVRVAGQGGNASGIGAKVSVFTPDRSCLLGYGEISTGAGYAGSKPPVVHMGLGTHTNVLVSARLPNGRIVEQELAVSGYRRVTLREPEVVGDR